MEDEPEVALLAHATRQWEAEVENAKRHGARMAGVLTLISAILGIGLFNLVNLHQLGLSGTVLFLRWMFAASLFWLARALIAGVWGTNAKPSASLKLALTDDVLEEGFGGRDPLELTKKEALQAAYACTLEAAQDLQEQNQAKQDRIDHVQTHLCWAAAYAILGILVFLVIPAPQPPLSTSSQPNSTLQQLASPSQDTAPQQTKER